MFESYHHKVPVYGERKRVNKVLPMNHTLMVIPPSSPRAQTAAKTRIAFWIETLVKTKDENGNTEMFITYNWTIYARVI